SSLKVRLARSSTVSATRIASGKRFVARSVSSLSFRIDHSLCSPFIGASPALAQLCDQICGELFGRKRQGLAFVGGRIAADEKAGRTTHFAAGQGLATATEELVL